MLLICQTVNHTISIYQCYGTKDAGHLACPACFEKLSGGKCLVCENGGPCGACSGKLPGAKCPLCDQGAVFKHCPCVENLLTTSVAQCKNKGCASWISLFDFEAHERAYPFQPVSPV